MAQIRGIDISRWQGIIDWQAVKDDANARFAMIKIGGSDDGFYQDGQAVRNMGEARRVGIPRGVYIYLGGAHRVVEEVQHIKNCLAAIGGLQQGEVLALDWEEQTADEVGYVSGIAQGLIDARQPSPMIYMSLSRVTGQDWSRLVKINNGLWVAAWGDNDAIPEDNEVPGSDEWPFWAIWQFSSTGTIRGIAGRVDLNVFNGDVATFQKYGVQGAVPSPPPAPVPLPAPAPAHGEYTVVAGDVLSRIAARYGITWQQLFAMNTDRISSPNRIFPGQKLRVPGTSPAPAPGVQHYTVRSGDTLSGIASRFATTWQQLYAWNRGIIGANPSFIKPGQTLRVR